MSSFLRSTPPPDERRTAGMVRVDVSVPTESPVSVIASLRSHGDGRVEPGRVGRGRGRVSCRRTAG
ncbi:hypothetical protein C9J85_06200 [Haloferax sp. wsp5]|nr:hypothetical protein C9J85_06200 [Haloferax sp. wsp5]